MYNRNGSLNSTIYVIVLNAGTEETVDTFVDNMKTDGKVSMDIRLME